MQRPFKETKDTSHDVRAIETSKGKNKKFGVSDVNWFLKYSEIHKKHS